MTKTVLNSELLDTFWDLAQGQDEKRVCAAKHMISVIKRFQVEVRNSKVMRKYER